MNPVLKSTETRLRIHHDMPVDVDTRRDMMVPGLDQACIALEKLTGLEWEQQRAGGLALPGSRAETGAIPLYDESFEEIGCLRLGPSSAVSALESDPAADLAAAMGRMVREIVSTQQALRQREAELATQIPISTSQQNAQQLATQLNAVIKGAVQALDCAAGALYVLDEATTELKLRAQHGLPSDCFVHEPRPLKEAIADLEALSGHAIVLQDTQLFQHWNVPQSYPAAVCVPVSTSKVILGTFWIFCDRIRDFSDVETNLVEIIAGRLSAELERTALLRQSKAFRSLSGEKNRLAVWQRERRELAPPSLDGWDVSGCVSGDGDLVGDFYFWCMNDDGSLSVAASGTESDDEESMVFSAQLKFALHTQLLHCWAAKSVLDDLNQVAWSNSPGNDLASMFYATIDPPSGQVHYSISGHMGVYIVRPYGWEPVTRNAPLLGLQPDIEYGSHVQQLDEGDILVAVSGRDHPANPAGASDNLALVAEGLLHHIHLPARELGQMATDLLNRISAEPRRHAVLIVKRRDYMAKLM